jgi:hypothetical protein
MLVVDKKANGLNSPAVPMRFTGARGLTRHLEIYPFLGSGSGTNGKGLLTWAQHEAYTTRAIIRVPYLSARKAKEGFDKAFALMEFFRANAPSKKKDLACALFLTFYTRSGGTGGLGGNLYLRLGAVGDAHLEKMLFSPAARSIFVNSGRSVNTVTQFIRTGAKDWKHDRWLQRGYRGPAANRELFYLELQPDRVGDIDRVAENMAAHDHRGWMDLHEIARLWGKPSLYVLAESSLHGGVLRRRLQQACGVSTKVNWARCADVRAMAFER